MAENKINLLNLKELSRMQLKVSPIFKPLLCFSLFVGLWHQPQLIAQEKAQAQQLPSSMQQLLTWELKANVFNKMSKRKAAEHFDAEYVEIPLRLVGSDISKVLETNHLQESLIDKSNSAVRWILNPEDSEYRLKIFKWLKKNGIQPKVIKNRFKGHLTASRSLIMQDMVTGTIFSAKVSTNHTGGGWQDKGVNNVQGRKARMVTDFVQQQYSKLSGKIQHIIFLPEPMAFFIEALNQSMIIRSYDRILEKPDHTYIPGFSALHPKAGEELASKNGSTDPNKFWKKNYSSKIAKAFAEFQAYFGLSYESAHSQQFLIELKDNKPTGKIVFRDYNDTYALDRFPHPKEMKDIWLKKYKHEDLQIRFGLLKAIKDAQRKDEGWISLKSRKTWAKAFFKTYEEHYALITGIKQDIQNQHIFEQGGSGTYALKSYFIESPLWKYYYSTIVTKCYFNQAAPEQVQLGNDSNCLEYFENPTQTVDKLQKSLNISEKGKIRGDNKLVNYLRVNALSRI